MASVGIFYGSDTGNTKEVAETIQQHFPLTSDIHDIAESGIKLVNNYDILILGIPTWYYGEAQTDWEEYLEELEGLDLSQHTVAIFGCGDQVDYSEYFLDAMGTLRDIVIARGARIIGFWPCSGYQFDASYARVSDTHFVGLGLDFDRQPELTDMRIQTWCSQVVGEIQSLEPDIA